MAGSIRYLFGAKAEPPECSRSREHPYFPRGGGGVFAGGDALFHWQRVFGHVASGTEGFLPWEDSVSVVACRHGLQIPRDDRISRQVHKTDWGGTDCASKPGSARLRRQSVFARNAEVLRDAEDPVAARCSSRGRI